MRKYNVTEELPGPVRGSRGGRKIGKETQDFVAAVFKADGQWVEFPSEDKSSALLGYHAKKLRGGTGIYRQGNKVIDSRVRQKTLYARAVEEGK